MLVNNNLKKNFKYKTDGLQLLSKIENDKVYAFKGKINTSREEASFVVDSMEDMFRI